METNVVTFTELADYCEKEIYVEAEYNNAGEKLSGVRDVTTYKAHLKHFKEFFKGKELSFFFILCLFSTLLFYKGALLKEWLVIFVMGCTIFQLKKLFKRDAELINITWLIFLLFVSALLKPYLLCFAPFCFTLFFFIYYSEKIKYKLKDKNLSFKNV